MDAGAILADSIREELSEREYAQFQARLLRDYTDLPLRRIAAAIPDNTDTEGPYSVSTVAAWTEAWGSLGGDVYDGELMDALESALEAAYEKDWNRVEDEVERVKQRVREKDSGSQQGSSNSDREPRIILRNMTKVQIEMVQYALPDGFIKDGMVVVEGEA